MLVFIRVSRLLGYKKEHSTAQAQAQAQGRVESASRPEL